MRSYLWAAQNRPALAAMATTTALDDNAAGDTTTFVTSSASQSVPSQPYVPSLTLSAPLTLVLDFGEMRTLDNWQVLARLDTGFQQTSSTVTVTTEYQDGQGAWQPLGAAQSFYDKGQWVLRQQTGLAIATRYVRLYLAASVIFYSPAGTTPAFDLKAADFRTVDEPPCTPPVVPVLDALRQITHHQPLIIVVGH